MQVQSALLITFKGFRDLRYPVLARRVPRAEENGWHPSVLWSGHEL